MGDFWVAGIVSADDKEPYVQLLNEKGVIAQLSVAQARIIAMNILVQCSRSEMDTMVYKFLENLGMEVDSEMPGGLMRAFRQYCSQMGVPASRPSLKGMRHEQ